MGQSTPNTPTCPTRTQRRILPDNSSLRLYVNWRSLIPTLVQGFLAYTSATTGKALQAPGTTLSSCKLAFCDTKITPITALFFDHFRIINVQHCKCSTIGQVLIAHGLFPTAPAQPRMAISIELLSFYRALFERSCDAVNALSSALNTFYIRRGFRMAARNGDAILEPFRRSLGQAVQWFDVLSIEIEHQTAKILQICREKVLGALNSTAPGIPPTNQSLSTPTASARCAEILVQRCPACFGGKAFGKPLEEGGDIHVALDGNFHHRHRRSAGDCPPFFTPEYIIPKAQVDEVGARIERERKKSPKVYKSPVPDEAIDHCENAYEAADGKKQKAAMDSFDDTGLMCIICRHDIPLFFANIDTPGEQQKFAIALLEHVFSLLPLQATVIALYDVGCVLARSVSKFNFLSDSIVLRLRFTTTAMHAYGHEWSCQLVYNPRMSTGLGLSDGEGVERLWSRYTRLIGVERSSSRQRRLWLIDRRALAIGEELLADLGGWIRRRLKKGVQDQGNTASRTLTECEVPMEQLESEWRNQRASQLSIRAHAPARLKKELDTVLALQSELEASEKAIQATRNFIAKYTQKASQETISTLESLERGHDRMITKVEALYSSLDVQDKFPELQGIDLEFARTLLMARDLKINIRKRAIGSFFEWDKLDQAVGGQHQALGTKLHQHTRKAIAKRQPALMTALRKFNGYCDRLASLYQEEWPIPLPQPLPTTLAALRTDQTLLEDIWINPVAGNKPRWLEDRNVREGIRAMLKRTRCIEEQRRLGIEADNLCRWFGDELAAVELALRLPTSASFAVILSQHREKLLQLQTRWVNPLVSDLRYQAQADRAIMLASQLSGSLIPMQFNFINSTQIFEADSDMDAQDPLTNLSATLDFGNGDNEDFLEPEQVTLSDILSGTTIEDSDDEADSRNEIMDVNLIWALSSTLTVDTYTPLVVYENATHPAQLSVCRVRPRQDGFPRQIFDTRDLAILTSPTARLNDTCINGGAALLYSHFLSPQAEQCAILSTHDLPRIRYGASDDDLWRNSSWTSYWTKDIWIIPIHRPLPVGHWVLCTVYLVKRELYLFDSFAEEQPWRNDIKDIMMLISRLLAIAQKHHGVIWRDMSGWIARPVQPTQTNGFDCGVWVLAAITSVLRGFEATGMHESQMAAMRRFIRALVLSIPVP
ncbi:hypothetical protein BJ138DRAFT_1138299 [Hygrophoropsis aurantiaca]|uniref:Uncharacterized protein n=1 Tax=Hygrophoropsis aurantiaca TaxID=72124 RepID=A0ACB7ZVV2_9AGAM|nr:hypothetical protein BJ138DRAFT_1138299 [Hygrophoropsis aurantiaca]